jgi:hypothetical protein
MNALALLMCAPRSLGLPLFVRSLHEQAPPFDKPEDMQCAALPDDAGALEDLVHFDSFEDIETPPVTDEMFGAAACMHEVYGVPVDYCVRFVLVMSIQTDEMRAFIASLPAVLVRELLIQVKQYSAFEDEVDALGRFIDKAWSVAADVQAGKTAPVNSLFAMLSIWTNTFEHVLAVPSRMDLPSLFQSFDELATSSWSYEAAARLRIISDWVERFCGDLEDAQASAAGADARWVVRLLASGSPFGDGQG